MNRKIKYGFRIIYNIFRIPIIQMVKLGKMEASFVQLISPSCRFNTEDGRIVLLGRLVAEPNTLIHSVSGEILIEDAFINRNATIVSMEKIEIGSVATIGPNVCIYDHDHSINIGGGMLRLLLKLEKALGLEPAVSF